MNIKAPNISKFQSLGIEGHFAGRTGRDDINSLYTGEKVKSVLNQENEIAEKNKKRDNTADDLNPEKGKVLLSYEQNGKDVGTSVDFDPVTNKSKKMQLTTEDGKLFRNVNWDEKGDINHVLEERQITEGLERTDFVTIDKNKDGTYKYEEGSVVGLDYGGQYLPGDHINELA